MNITKIRAIAIVTGSTGGWSYAGRITTPNPSCLKNWRIRTQLRALYPGASDVIAGRHVYRVNNRKINPRYIVGGSEAKLTFDKALALLEGREVA